MLPRRLQRFFDAVPERDAKEARQAVDDYMFGLRALDLTKRAVLAGNKGIRGFWATLTGFFTSRDTHVPSDRFLAAYTRFVGRREV